MKNQLPRRFAVRQSGWQQWAALAIVLAISAIAALPLFWTGVSQAFDTPIHLARLGALDHALRQGEWYPRWLPNLLLGHGYPLFNYYAPAPYYVAATLLRLGANAADAYSLSYAIFLGVAGVGMYRWARDLYGRESAAILAAAAYLFTPYLLLNTYVRGSFAEVCAQAVLPWLFWAFRRLMLAERPAAYVPMAALTLGALAMSHNITLLLTPAVLVAYLLLLAYTHHSNKSGIYKREFARANLWAVAASLLLAMGVSAFFWLPLILERGLLRDTAYEIARYGWLPGNVWQWDNFLHRSLPYIYNDNDAPGPVQLSIVQCVLALVGFVLALSRPHRPVLLLGARGHGSQQQKWRVSWTRRAPDTSTQRGELWLLLGILVVAGLCVGAWALPIWQSNRIFAIVQFPWRLLVIMSLPLALAVGGFTVGLQHRWMRVGVALLVVALVMWAHYPRLALISFFNDTSLAITVDHVAQIEQYKGAKEGGERTSSVQEFKPRWVSLNLLLDSSTVTPAADESPSLEVKVLAANAWHKEVMVNSPQPAQLRFNQFYFPGWVIQNNQETVPSYPSTNLGLLTIDLAAGSNHITLDWRGTRVERVAVWITLLALATLVACCWLSGLRRGWLAVSVVLLAMALVSAFYEPQPEAVQPPALPLASAGIELVGLRHEHLTPDALDLYPVWYVSAPLPEALEMRWQLVDAQGNVVVDWTGKPFHNSYSADNFPPQTLVEDAYHLALPALAAGDYALRGQLVMEGEALLPLVEVGTVTLREPTPPLPVPAYPLSVNFEEGIILDGYDVELPDWLAKWAVTSGVPVVASGGRLQLWLWWRADAPTEENFHGFVHLVDSSGQPIEQVDQLPGPLFQPPMLWNAQRPAPDVYDLYIPDDAPSGIYWPWVGLYRHPSQNRLMVTEDETSSVPEDDGLGGDHFQLAPIKIVNQAAKPQPATEVTVKLGDFAEWIGYDLQIADSVQPGESMTLTLYYEGVTPTAVGYTRFVHAVHPTTGLVTQADAIPQNGANPTWSWQPGEIIADPLTITFPPNAPAGEYQLLLGFYAPEQGGARLPLQSDEASRVLAGDQTMIARVTVTN